MPRLWNNGSLCTCGSIIIKCVNRIASATASMVREDSGEGCNDRMNGSIAWVDAITVKSTLRGYPERSALVSILERASAMLSIP